MLALIVESAHLVRLRWDFNDEACGRAWQLCIIAIAIAGSLIYLDGPPRLAASILLTWMPPLLLPMQFIQSFGLKDSVPVNTFSLLAKHRRKRNARLGLTESVVHVNFGNIYFVTALIGSTLGNQSSGPYAWLFLPGMIVLTGWMLLSSSRSRRTSLVVALIVAGCIAIAGQKGLEELDNRLGNSGTGGRSGFDPNSHSTLIGKRGSIEQSPEIVWRLRPLENKAPPTLLRTASYNTYREDGRWICQPYIEQEFNDLDTRLQDDEPYFIVTPNSSEAEQIRAVGKGLRRFSLRGSAAAETPLALPGSTSSLTGFELDGIQRNSFGTIRVFPKQSVIEGTVLWQGDNVTENPAILTEDLKVPFLERGALKAVLKELRLLKPTFREAFHTTDRSTPLAKLAFDLQAPPQERLSRQERFTLQQKLDILRFWFQRKFRYSRNLTIDVSPSKSAIPTAIQQFLTETRKGHCEYFAAATVLLLREAGIPARYAIGYGVMERDAARKEYVIRGTHGHAWCRVWDANAGKWIDFDTTPGSWFEVVEQQNTMLQRFYDSLKRLREDFFLWRNQPSNRLAVSVVMSAIALGVVAFIMKRLWKSKRRLDTEKRSNGYTGPVIRTPLNAFESQARKQLGSRPPGQPFAEWLIRLRPTLPDAGVLDEALELHQRLRFDPAPSVPGEMDRLAELAKQLESAIKR
ncbi:MAG: transglutaminase-like domain-containing protein [Verrucomicrobiota bacterium]